MNTTVILCGMPAENAILTATFPNNLVLTGTAKNNLATLVPATCTRIVSMGLCGGLAYTLFVADVVLAGTVTDGNGNNWHCDADWNAAFLDMASASRLTNEPWSRDLRIVPWFSSGVMDLADTKQQRAALFAKTGARAIDDETFSVATFCAARKIPFNVVRAVSDGAGDTLPPAARGAIMNANGSENIAYLLSQLETESLGEDFDLLGVAADFNDSLAALGACAKAMSAMEEFY